MKIKMIGTGAIYTKDASSSILVDDEILCDVPNGVLKEMLRQNVDVLKLKVILITHFHGDHIADIPFLLLYLFKNLKREEKIRILGPGCIASCVLELAKAYHYDNLTEIIDNFVEFVELEAERTYTLYNLTNEHYIQPKYVDHKDIEALGYIIDNKLGISGDTILCPGVEQMVDRCTLSILDTSNIQAGSAHMGIDNIKYLIDKYNHDIVPTHLRAETRKALETEDNIHILLKNDGDEIIFE